VEVLSTRSEGQGAYPVCITDLLVTPSAYRLHHIEKVVILDHQDCGAYASKIDPDLSKDPEREQQVHADYLNRAYQAIRQRYPELDVELYFVTINGSVKPILLSMTVGKTEL